ncbi:MAG TPA: hypothetical protein VFJ72_09425 [Rubrobacteraceae bacterium]|nr:hypothetical protein [Rubrobacteraceae bacterium]
MAPSSAGSTTDVEPIEIEARIAGGILALNRFLMTLQNKRMPVARISVDGDRDGTRIGIALDCPEETARRYATLLESLEDVEEIRFAERPAQK